MPFNFFRPISKEDYSIKLNTVNLKPDRLEDIAGNEKLIKTQTRMIQQEKLASIGELAAGVAHELNNPLGFVTNNFVI